ncbi:uncharacterized protein PFL1_06873 [Pseudozyma flocculosa PF-1]|uniref:Uncharacterized protein n=2 Tax=Pseudozyma flocculosa TaxID=84751 RepID=A0A5C3F4H9_9BASI|nr:uncharacterized protein PFL1_06873 [Pseudozyma flocculosa PF-1]EPQ28916.1 hypothetical protein PFL1_06873 [Pseudozyma flocculosa PF-1]SPO38597.1 uncharacterized protein PSFLO_04075 [Pseudozyma flocculosa]
MGCVFSCLASTFIYAGEVLQQLCLAVGEISAVLVRALFGLVVVLCDVLAAVSCCWRVPWSERPDRSTYSYDTRLLADVGGQKVLSGAFTKQGREQRRQIKEARNKERELEAEQRAAKRKEEKEAKEKQKAAAKAEVADEKAAAKKEETATEATASATTTEAARA